MICAPEENVTGFSSGSRGSPSCVPLPLVAEQRGKRRNRQRCLEKTLANCAHTIANALPFYKQMQLLTISTRRSLCPLSLRPNLHLKTSLPMSTEQVNHCVSGVFGLERVSEPREASSLHSRMVAGGTHTPLFVFLLSSYPPAPSSSCSRRPPSSIVTQGAPQPAPVPDARRRKQGAGREMQVQAPFSPHLSPCTTERPPHLKLNEGGVVPVHYNDMQAPIHSATV